MSNGKTETNEQARDQAIAAALELMGEAAVNLQMIGRLQQDAELVGLSVKLVRCARELGMYNHFAKVDKNEKEISNKND